ncbi:kinase-like domain-containing protein [Rhizophagus irregularis DAOM 181602=DAOM 197198]|uniref:Cdc15p n=3 Tax=Rhizophagus irregularis TaxID=588596 RepID=A0A015IJZ5_RHIIW|nr:kinase-like domain-containing protein [Rhizophagus irregularis DAOM 181602=DAOM 197198]EXX57482.1 Cdc15p [Rhizophagus irregularis DAOM 197198w]POG80164.1 kinase-like domain-containing protein [Rhizophagus irregularis DAOM 181602=DAOM 197198]|eukprot:XP_025187030.1 kinase-like domain-containing protein [Rhizophagus irregularis DAOM 181602=DAOM 197198]
MYSWKRGSAQYQEYVSIFHINSTAEEEYNKTDDRVIYIEDLEKREEIYGTCWECKEPGTGELWCQSCNAKRFKENFKNWTSGNKDIDEFIQDSQLNAVSSKKCLEWITYEDLQDITYITRGGFGKVYSATWTKGFIIYWDIDNQEYYRSENVKVALKSLDDSFDTNLDLLNEIKSYLHMYTWDIIQYFGITQDPNSKEYMMVLEYCECGNLRNYLNENYMDIKLKIQYLFHIARGLQNIHDAKKVHGDLHIGNILLNMNRKHAYISDLGMCRQANNDKEGGYGVLPYMSPEILRGCQYTKAADIYSFGIVMNELMSEETPYSNIPHDHTLAVGICKGLRPNISEDIPKPLADLIVKCWDAKAENRPTAKELSHKLRKWRNEIRNMNGNFYSQIKGHKYIKRFNNENISKNISKNIETHPQAIYTSRLLSFKNLPEPVNSNDLVSECFDCVIDETA